MNLGELSDLEVQTIIAALDGWPNAEPLRARLKSQRLKHIEWERAIARHRASPALPTRRVGKSARQILFGGG